MTIFRTSVIPKFRETLWTNTKLIMLVNQIIIFITGALVAILGALPFGLVNLTVFDVSMKRGNSHALSIAYGAALVEVFYGLIAILAGSLVKNYIDGNIIILSFWYW